MRLLVKSDGLVRFFVVLMDSLHFFMGIHSTVFLRRRHQASRGNGNKKNRGSKGKKGKKKKEQTNSSPKSLYSCIVHILE